MSLQLLEVEVGAACSPDAKRQSSAADGETLYCILSVRLQRHVP